MTQRSLDPTRLTPELLILGYTQGAFPMARSRGSDEIEWFRPDPRAIMPLDGMRLTRSLNKRIRSGCYEIKYDQSFSEVVRRCAAPRRRDHDSWINREILDAYVEMHQLGLAHSVEAYRDGELVGGLYGMAIGAAFFGESMFHDPKRGTDASKVCLHALLNHLNHRGYQLLDVQIQSPHMARLGAIEIPLDEFMDRLFQAIHEDVTWAPEVEED